MIECPYCHKDLAEDSTFCTYCGKPLKKVSMKDLEKAEAKIEKQREKEKNGNLKKNPRENNWSKLGLMVFLICVIGLDFVVSSVFATMGMNPKSVFILSFVGYIFSIGCGAMSLVVDYQDKKRGFAPNGNSKIAFVCIVMGIYIALLNLTTVILK